MTLRDVISWTALFTPLGLAVLDKSITLVVDWRQRHKERRK